MRDNPAADMDLASVIQQKDELIAQLLAALKTAHKIMRDEGYRAGNNPHMREVETAIAEAANKTA